MTGVRYPFLDHAGPIAFAHRGGAHESPENTWTSFTHAHDLGYVYMETDVHATSDGVVVTIHDPDLARTSDRSGLVRDMRWKDVSAVRLGGNEPIPRLDELFEAWPEVRWNIDAKHESVVAPLIETIEKCRVLDRVCITSFSDRRLARLRRALGRGLCTAIGPAGIAWLRLASLLPAPAASRVAAPLGRFGAAQVPLRQGAIPIIDTRFLDLAHKTGLAVHIWTIDDEMTMARILDLGVDGIMTDRPSALKTIMQRRGQWS